MSTKSPSTTEIEIHSIERDHALLELINTQLDFLIEFGARIQRLEDGRRCRCGEPRQSIDPTGEGNDDAGD